MRKRIYISGPITNGNTNDREKVLSNVRVGDYVFHELVKSGFAPFWIGTMACFIPPSQSADPLVKGVKPNWNDWMDVCLAWLEKADGMLVLPGWEDSLGSVAEVDFARSKRIPVFSSIERLERYYEN